VQAFFRHKQQLGTVAYAENFHGEISFSVIWWPFVFGMRYL